MLVYSMMKLNQLLLFFIPLFGSAQTWQQITDFPGIERDDGVVFVIDNKAYCGTGYDSGFNPTFDFYSLNLANDTWSAISGMPISEARQYAASAVWNDQGYVFGGVGLGGASALNDLWRYDPLSDTWTELESLPSNGRTGASSFVIADTLYIFGGRNESGIALNELWAYDFSANSWSQRTGLNAISGMWRGASTEHNNRGVVFFGVDASNDFIEEMYWYDPVSDSWSVEPGLTLNGRSYPVYAKMGDYFLSYSGVDDSGIMTSFERYNFLTGQLDVLTSLPSFGRKGGFGFGSTSSFYVCAGVSDVARVKETWKANSPLNLSANEGFKDICVYQNGGQLLFEVEEIIKELELFDHAGRLVKAAKSSNVLSLSGLDTGIYFYRVSLNGQETSGKVWIDL